VRKETPANDCAPLTSYVRETTRTARCTSPIRSASAMAGEITGRVLIAATATAHKPQASQLSNQNVNPGAALGVLEK
jgi:hypothetical protein